jgi:hypothetical protein
MLSRTVSRYALPVLCLMLLPLSRAGAEPILWSYGATAVPTGPYVDPSYATMQSFALTFSDRGNMAVAVSAISGGGETHSTENAIIGSKVGWDFTALNLQPVIQGTYQSNFGVVGNLLANKNTFDYTLRLTDGASGASRSLVFHGGLTGSIWLDIPNFPASQLTTTYSNPTQSLQLGNNMYTVTMGQDANMFVQMQTAPEPSTLALLAVGLAGLGLRACRHRRGRWEPRPAA